MKKKKRGQLQLLKIHFHNPNAEMIFLYLL